jgi:ribonuclease H / adenosylcobalamin/alpha-ribazole phosphatase
MNRPEALAPRLFEVLRNIPGTVSVTLVGSFVDRCGAADISDIDTVVVFDTLTPDRFTSAVRAVQELSGEDLGFPGKTVRVNATLGPLKFDDEGQVVIHLMPYDLASHRAHVLNSPFTCFDWERSTCHSGPSLRELYPVGALQPGDFQLARRGLANYLDDLESGTLSYRRLEPAGDRIVEVPDRVTLDRRHIGEYAYHIIRNLIANALKLKTGANGYWEGEHLVEMWRTELPRLSAWVPAFERLEEVKRARGSGFPSDTLATTRRFIDAFAAWLEQESTGAYRLDLLRHAPTALNDGSFLGRRRDPGVAEAPPASTTQVDRVYSSPLRRAMETARALAGEAAVVVDDRLAEIDYGLAEGLTAGDARARFPELARAWDAGIDAPFPEGERTSDVLERARAFLASLPSGPGAALAVTHNVVLRAIAADLLRLDLRRSYRIGVPHLLPLRVTRVAGRWVTDFDRDTKARLLDGYAGWTNG